VYHKAKILIDGPTSTLMDSAYFITRMKPLVHSKEFLLRATEKWGD